MKKVFYILPLAMLLLLSACSATNDKQFIDNQEEISKYVKIIDCYIEKAPGENTITSNSNAVVKYQNISDKVLMGVFLYVDYLDKEGKPIGGVLLVDESKNIILPNHIEVGRQELWAGNPKPEDIYDKEWDGRVQPRIVHIWVSKQTPTVPGIEQ